MTPADRREQGKARDRAKEILDIINQFDAKAVGLPDWEFALDVIEQGLKEWAESAVAEAVAELNENYRVQCAINNAQKNHIAALENGLAEAKAGQQERLLSLRVTIETLVDAFRTSSPEIHARAIRVGVQMLELEADVEAFEKRRPLVSEEARGKEKADAGN